MVAFFWSKSLSKLVKNVILLKKCLKNVNFLSHIFETIGPGTPENMIFGFGFSTCRRKKCWGFQIWPYFFWKVGQKRSKLTIFQSISKCWKMNIFWKTPFFGFFGQFFRQNKARFGLLEKFYVDVYISKLSRAFILLVTESYKHQPVCKKHI